MAEKESAEPQAESEVPAAELDDKELKDVSGGNAPNVKIPGSRAPLYY